MSASAPDYKKRPPPIAIPEWPPSCKAYGHNVSTTAPPQVRGSATHQQRIVPSSTQTSMRSGTTTPLTSPFESDEMPPGVPKSGSQGSKHRSSKMTTFSGLMDQARSSPRKSECSSVPSRHGSTTRSRQSERSHHSAVAAQALLESLDEDKSTTRSQIESRSEKILFKMTGQIPPTPTSGPVDPDRVFIRTEDLRAKCRAVSVESIPEGNELTKSPKKKLFGVSLPKFSKTAATDATPIMPSKAAQILGATTPSRRPRRIEPRPIKSARVIKTPTKSTRSDTARSLTARVYDEATSVEAHNRISTRRRRTVGRRSPGKENTPPKEQVTAQLSFESTTPPTPPAKDTPPEYRLPQNPPSPLRRAPSREDLRESYSDHPRKGVQVHLPFPMFALSPSPPKTAIPDKSGGSPTKFRSYTAEDYKKLIEGEALQWPCQEGDEEGHIKLGGQSAPLVAEQRDLLQLPLSSRSDDKHYNERIGRRLSPLPPRFYSPSCRSVQLFTEGESPSQNTDTNRLLFAPPKLNLPLASDTSTPVEMVHQSSMKATKPDCAEPKSTNDDVVWMPGRDMHQQHHSHNIDLATRVKQELRLGEQHQVPTMATNKPDNSHRDSTSSKLGNMLNNAATHTEVNGDLRTQGPSTGPIIHAPRVSMPPAPAPRGTHGPAGHWPSPRTEKTIEDHFFMTNEHLDVVGKTTYDALDMYTKQQISATNAKHDQLVALLEKHMDGLKSQISSVNDKVDNASNQTHNIGLKFDQLEKFIKNEILNAITEQTKQAAEIQASVREMQKTMSHMQQTTGKLADARYDMSHSDANALPVSGMPTLTPQPLPAHHSQSTPTGYFGNETSRDEHLQERPVSHNYDAHSDPRGNYSTNWQAQSWNGRSNYNGRNKGDASSYAGASPYHFGNGGQYNNGYGNGYSSYNFSPTNTEQPYSYGQKPAQ